MIHAFRDEKQRKIYLARVVTERIFCNRDQEFQGDIAVGYGGSHIQKCLW
jgi:hypothetical protein